MFCPACLLLWVTELTENVQSLARTIRILLKPWSCLFVWAIIFQWSFFQLPTTLQILWKKIGTLSQHLIEFCSSKCWVSGHLYIIIIITSTIQYFSGYLKYLFWLHIMSNKGESQCSFYCNRTGKGQFQLQMLILCKGTGASFKTNTFLSGRS